MTSSATGAEIKKLLDEIKKSKCECDVCKQGRIFIRTAAIDYIAEGLVKPLLGVKN